MPEKTGRFAIIEQFLADGMNVMFGNPGTVEQGFLDALSEYPQMKYILTLQESIAVMAADGYARATKKPTLVQLHSSPGIGNAVGALYQAKRGHAPLVVIGGDAGLKYMNMDAQMAADLVAMMEPVTKWSTMVLDSTSLLRVLRRAVKIAATPPMGPVYICLPADILDIPALEPVMPASIPSTRVAPAPEDVRRAAEMLANASTPMIFAGDGVAYSGAQAELERVADLLGAEVWEADSGELNLRYDHPLYQGMTGHMFGKNSLPITSKGDANLVVGTYMLPEVFPELDDIFAPGAKVVHFDLNAYEIAKNHRVDLGIVSDPKISLDQEAERSCASANRRNCSA
jgi:thiamine pyrophosphate-dependent acetolactate synthase large subunit-like protein